MTTQQKIIKNKSVNGLVIDGVTANARNMQSANTSFFKATTAVVDVMPGEHQVKITYVGGNAVSMDPITYNFEAGKIYMITPGVSNVYVGINTDPTVAGLTAMTIASTIGNRISIKRMDETRKQLQELYKQLQDSNE